MKSPNLLVGNGTKSVRFDEVSIYVKEIRKGMNLIEVKCDVNDGNVGIDV